MIPEYIIVQAGGKGTRMQHLTTNKPKALVPVDNLPMLFHLFKKYPQSNYVIIGDYCFDVLQRYLKAFARVHYSLIYAKGKKGTCAGLRRAVDQLPPDKPFMLIWSDLILPEEFKLPEQSGNFIGIAEDFPCRWKYKDNCFTEERSDTFGVAGLFWFQNATELSGVPEEGEFVRWLSTEEMSFQSIPLSGVKEYGLLAEYDRHYNIRCRPFNKVYQDGQTFVKEAIDTQGEALAVREAAWYQRLGQYGFPSIPQVFCYQPLKMEYVSGGAIYANEKLTGNEKISVLKQIVMCLQSIHGLESTIADQDSYHEAYIGKTFQRLEKVRDLVPFAKDKTIQINGKRCRNAFYCKDEISKALEQYMPDRFALIHGDCTFSNILLRGDGSPVLIDPRGYFGYTELFGDPAYDWAKLYYSIVGNYDQFNRKQFSLEIGKKEIHLQIRSNGWEDMESEFFRLLQDEVTVQQMHLLHAIIWLSLTTYTWDDYDSICGAFYNGLYYLEEAFDEGLL